MLGFWRKQSKWLTYGIFGLIVFVFVIWGFERRQAGETGSGTAAQVNGDLIPVRAYKQELNRRVTMYQQMLGGKFEGDIAKQMNLPARTLQDLISRQLAAQAAAKMGIMVADSEVRERLMQVTFLQKDGKFSRENYDAMLRYYQMGASEFEDTLRHDAAIEEAQEAFTNALVNSPSQVALSDKLKSAKFNLEFLKLDSAGLASSVTVSDSEVAAYVASPDNQKRLDEYLKANGDEFSTPARTHARHILISTQNGTSEAVAQEKIKKALAELKTFSFDKVAQKISDDPASKKKGGDLGWYSAGQMVPEFEKAADNLKIGQISEPVKSAFGIHLIKVEAREAAKTSTPEQAKKLVAKKLVAQQKLEAELNVLDKGYAADPSKQVAELQRKIPSLKWEETGVFSMDSDRVPKLGETDDLQAGAFSVSEKEPWGKHVFHEGGARYILRYKAVPASELAKKAEPKDKGPTPLDSVGNENVGRGVFIAWIGQLGKKAKIVTNTNLLQQQTEVE